MKKTKQYCIINTKELTMKEYFLSYDDFGEVIVSYSRDIIEYGECKKYVNSTVHFIMLAHKYIVDENNDLCEYIESGKYVDMIESYKRLY